MDDNSPEDKPQHAEKVRRVKPNRSLRLLPSNAREAWPANFGEVLEWYTNEVEDVTRAAQLRLRNAAQVINDYRENKVSFENTRKRVFDYDRKWGQIFPGQVEGIIRGKSDEEIEKAIAAAKESRGRD
jgi:hypothetical protein